MPVSLVAVWCGRHLLLVFDRSRRQWELPGGRIDPGSDTQIIDATLMARAVPST